MKKTINLKRFIGIPFFFLISMMGCAADVSEEQIIRAIKNNPEIVTQVIKNNTDEILDYLQDAAVAKFKKEQLENALSKRLEPIFSDTRPLKPGSVDNPKIEIVIYSDFSCVYCKDGAKLLSRLQEKYKDQTKIIFKHSASNQAAYHKALMFEAAGQIDPKLAWDLHDFMFDHQEQLFENIDIVNAELTKRGIVLKDFYNTMNSDVILSHISADNEELRKFDIKGTPTFIINGVKIEGVLPFEDLEAILEKII